MVRDTACRSVLITVGFLLGLTALGCTPSSTRRQQDSRGITAVPSMPLVSAVERRVALVIGNDRYQHVTQLERAVSDAQAIGVALRQLGFEVLARINLDREGMIEAIGALVDRIARGGVGVLFFAGHGVQLGGENFLLPIDVKVARVDDLPDKAIALGRVMEPLWNRSHEYPMAHECRVCVIAARLRQRRQEGRYGLAQGTPPTRRRRAIFREQSSKSEYGTGPYHRRKFATSMLPTSCPGTDWSPSTYSIRIQAPSRSMRLVVITGRSRARRLRAPRCFEGPERVC